MSVTLQLLGRPTLTGGAEPAYRFRSQKSWAVLAFLLLTDRPPERARLAELLFDTTQDPLGALRWNLAEIRRGLGPKANLEGDPVVLTLPEGSVVDVHVVTSGSWVEAVALPGVGEDLLAGINVQGSASFDAWLQTERRRLTAASEAVLHEAAQALLARHDLPGALRHARLVTSMSPLDENHHALLLRLLKMSGDDAAADAHYAHVRRLLHDELGATPGVAVDSAMQQRSVASSHVSGAASIEAILESGAAAVAAGAIDSGISTLRTGVHLADEASDTALQVRARLALAESLIHSLRGLDEEGLSALYEADVLASRDEDAVLQAEIRAELGYVDFLRARYDRAERRLMTALELAGSHAWVQAKALTYLGSAQSDHATYPSARDHLAAAMAFAREADDPRREIYAATMIGRLHLLTGDLDAAHGVLGQAIALGERERWLAFLPWPQSFLGELLLLQGQLDDAGAMLDHAFARACQLGDPCWEGVSARGLALVADALGDPDRAFVLLADARVRCNRHTDPYVWLDAYILDAQCTLGIRHGHPKAGTWATELRVLAARTAMREMTVRALLHRTALGDHDALSAAELLAGSIDNPRLAAAVHAARPTAAPASPR